MKKLFKSIKQNDLESIVKILDITPESSKKSERLLNLF